MSDAGGCATSSDCAQTEFCAKTAGDCSGVGACTTIPGFCPQVVAQVCGCNHKTYNNYCYAQKGRTSVAYTGACE